MDLSGNICGFCCTVYPSSMLVSIPPAEEVDLVTFLLGEELEEKGTVLTCPTCRAELGAFSEFFTRARSNIAKLRSIKQEQQELRTKAMGWVQEKPPDNSWSNSGTDQVLNLSSRDLEISVRQSPSPEVESWRRDNTVTITPLSSPVLDTEMSEADQSEEMREANRVRNVRYRERKRAREAEMRGYIRCISSLTEVEEINVTPDLALKIEDRENDRREEAVSPPPCLTPPQQILTSTGNPILIPGGVQSFHFSPPTPPPSDPDERRKQRNREASRRYRERAREDPELLKRMREQQNRRQKKYYARLKERKGDKESYQGRLSIEDSGESIPLALEWGSQSNSVPV